MNDKNKDFLRRNKICDLFGTCRICIHPSTEHHPRALERERGETVPIVEFAVHLSDCNEDHSIVAISCNKSLAVEIAIVVVEVLAYGGRCAPRGREGRVIGGVV